VEILTDEVISRDTSADCSAAIYVINENKFVIKITLNNLASCTWWMSSTG
jgi:hypothetical protein